MQKRNLKKVLLSTLLIFALVMPALAGCAGAVPTAGPAADLATLSVPNTDLDMILYLKQGSPTRIPATLVSASSDIMVESLAIYGIARTEEKYAIGGALTFASAADAARVNSQIPKRPELWSQLTDRTIYFVQSLGDPAENLKSALSKRDFKPFNDKKALTELAMLPAGGATAPVAVGIIKPNPAMFKALERIVDKETASALNTVSRWGRMEMVTLGLYSASQIDVADMARRMMTNTLKDADLGALIVLKSALPGFVVNFAANRALEGAGYPAVTVGDATVRKVPPEVSGAPLSVYLTVSGNRVIGAASLKDAYAQTLMTAVKK